MARKYTEQDRLNALNLIKEGASITDAGLELNIPRTTVSSWYRAHLATTVDERLQRRADSDDGDELQRLRVENAELKERVQSIDALMEKWTPAILWVMAKMKREAKESVDANTTQTRLILPKKAE
jgi:hypothetical protein